MRGNLAPARWRAAALAGMWLMAGLCLNKAQAQANYVYDNCELIGGPAVVAHVVGTFEDDSKRRDTLTGWIDIPHHPAWTCTRYSRDAHSTLKNLVKVLTRTKDLSRKIEVDGETYTAYASGANHKIKVGYVMRRRTVVESGGLVLYDSGMVPVMYNTDDWSHKLEYTLVLEGTQVPYTVSHDTQVRLVKWRDVNNKTDFPRAGEAIDFEVGQLQYWTSHKGTNPKGLPKMQPDMKPRHLLALRVWFNHKDRTCSTPSVQTVILPQVPKTAFTGAGSTAGNTPFELKLTDCAVGISGIEYKLVPSYLETPTDYPKPKAGSWPNTHAKGTLPLSPSASATGVGVQVLDGNGTPVVFDRESRTKVLGFSAGDTTTRIPLQVQYIQTGYVVTAGTVLATMTALYMYK